jgi:hypothetical protein
MHHYRNSADWKPSNFPMLNSGKITNRAWCSLIAVAAAEHPVTIWALSLGVKQPLASVWPSDQERCNGVHEDLDLLVCYLPQVDFFIIYFPTLKIDVVYFWAALAECQPSTRQYIPEDRMLHTLRLPNWQQGVRPARSRQYQIVHGFNFCSGHDNVRAYLFVSLTWIDEIGPERSKVSYKIRKTICSFRAGTK